METMGTFSTPTGEGTTMGTKTKRNTQIDSADTAGKSLRIADRGIHTSADFRNFMSALMSDVISGAVTASVTNAACNAGGKMLKMVELEYKYATRPKAVANPILTVAFEDPAVPAVKVQAALPAETF